MSEHERNPVEPDGSRTSEFGEITIDNEVIAAVAARAGSELDGITITGTGVAGNLARVLGRKGPERGVRVTSEGGGVSIDLTVVVQFGLRIPEAVEMLQRKVKETVEQITGIGVQAVNVAVVGIAIPEPGEGGGNEGV